MLQNDVNWELPATLTFDHPSIAALSNYLASHASAGGSGGGTSFEVPSNAIISQDDIELQLQGIVAELLGSDVPPEQPLMEAGLDSLGAVELRDRVAAAFQAEVPATLTFDYPSIFAMSQYISQHHSSAVQPTTSWQQYGNSSALVAHHDPSLLLSPASEVAAISCRYPGAATEGGDSSSLFWNAFSSSAELQAVVPFDRWDMERAYSPEMGSDNNMRFYARFAAYCTGVQLFDAAAFHVTVQEAAAMDPQIRMLMQEAAQAWSSASTIGIGAQNKGSNTISSSVGQSVGVYVGCMYHEHLDVVTSSSSKLSPQAIVGNGAPYMVGRLSYTFGFSGPCISTDTACSSALVSAHLAHTALHNYECASAMAAGTNVMLLADTTAAICQLQALSPVGRCKTFDASADGYGRGEGFTVIVLQRQGSSTANSGQQQPVALVVASAVNQGGRSSGLTAPNGPAQTALVRTAMAAGQGITPAQLGVISIHGTGTPLGDPIEIGALAQALPQGHSGVAVISNKSCFGHTEGAAGLTGLLAAMGSLRQAMVPGIMHLREINPYVTSALGDWTRQRGGAHAGAAAPRQKAPAPVLLGDAAMLTGTSSFGMSGVNAHAILSSTSEIAQLKSTTSYSRSAWKLQRMYIMPPAHALLQGIQLLSSGSIAHFSCAISASSALSYLWDHQIIGVSVLPPAALVELAAAARILLLGDAAVAANSEVAMISEATIAAILQLSGDDISHILSCVVENKHGLIQISAENQNLCYAQVAATAAVLNADAVAEEKQKLVNSVSFLHYSETNSILLSELYCLDDTSLSLSISCSCCRAYPFLRPPLLLMATLC
jgi:3-oxoacyl-(acyl-carrier-protein) synthase/acyl carrier protein